jgi:hypothetical protein
MMSTIQVNLLLDLLYPLLLCAALLALALLGDRIERLLRRAPYERRVRTRLWHPASASRRLCWTAYGAVALPEPLVRRWNSPHLYRNDWETMSALSELVCDDIGIVSRSSDREVSVCPQRPPQTRHGLLKLRKWGPKFPN